MPNSGFNRAAGDREARVHGPLARRRREHAGGAPARDLPLRDDALAHARIDYLGLTSACPPANPPACRTHGVLARSLDLARLVVGRLDLVERAVGVLARPLHAKRYTTCSYPRDR